MILKMKTLKTFLLTDLVSKGDFEIVRPGEFSITHYAGSMLPYSLCFAENEHFAMQANRNTNVTVVITTSELQGIVGQNKGLVISTKPRKLFFEIHNRLKEFYTFSGINPKIAPSAEIHPTAIIKDGVIVGERTKIGAYSILEEGTIIGEDVLIENHVVIGARGMHNTKIDGRFLHVHDLGNVVIGDRCEILSHATIQKPYFYHSTVIGEETRISVYGNVGHGCYIGKRCLIAGHTVIAGYSTVGNDVWIGPNSTISHMVHVKDNASIMLGSVVISDVRESESVSGNFAFKHAKNFRLYSRNKN